MSKKSAELDVIALDGKWERKEVCTGVKIFASFDAKKQFMTQEGKTSDVQYRINLPETIDGEERIVVVPNALPCRPVSVHIYWPTRVMDKAWELEGNTP